MRRLPVLAAAVLLVAAFTVPGPVSDGQQLAYRVPSPATVTYVATDTTRLTITTAMGPMDIAGGSSFTFATTFTAEGDGVRVAGALTAFSAQFNDPMSGTTRSLNEAQAGAGSFEVVLDRVEATDVVTGATRPSNDDLPIFADPVELMFPRLPGAEVQPGDSWGDTVLTKAAGGELNREVVYTYTLVGETVVDGRTHLRVDIAGDVQLTMGEEMGMSQSLAGTETGFFLWDVEMGLPARAEVARAYSGEFTVPGQGAMKVDATATTRIRVDS